MAKRKESEAQAQRESIEASEAESQRESIEASEAESQRESIEASEAESQKESIKASEAESQKESIEASEAESQQESIKASEAESQQESIEASEAESQQESIEASEAESQQESIKASEAESQQESIEASEAESQQESIKASEAESQQESIEASEAESQQESIEASEAESQQESIEASEAESQQESIEASEAESQRESLDESEVLAAEALGYKIGGILTFGTYEQDNDLSNGSEPIEWIVLDIEDGKVLLLSKYGLDAIAYNENWYDVTWETCDLREWLNNVFYREAFSEQERKIIDYTTVITEDSELYGTDGGNNTQDRIFCLSISEVSRYFEDDASRICYPTKYARSLNIYPLYDDTDGASCTWWLRSPGNNSRNFVCILEEGDIRISGLINMDHHICVRPAMWINLSS